MLCQHSPIERCFPHHTRNRSLHTNASRYVNKNQNPQCNKNANNNKPPVWLRRASFSQTNTTTMSRLCDVYIILADALKQGGGMGWVAGRRRGSTKHVHSAVPPNQQHIRIANQTQRGTNNNIPSQNNTRQRWWCGGSILQLSFIKSDGLDRPKWILLYALRKYYKPRVCECLLSCMSAYILLDCIGWVHHIII